MSHKRSKADSLPGRKSKSSRQWLRDHFDDYYVKQAQQQGYRSRAVYKLLEIQEKDQIIRPGMTVVDLGAAPGGWSQVAAAITGRNGRVIALDILEMDPIEYVQFLHGDFTEPEPLEVLLAAIGEHNMNLVMSDMTPNISGIKAVDQPKSMYLAELALDLAQNVLCSKGDFLVKVFQGTDFDIYYKQLKSVFEKVYTRKPKASKSNSREVYLLARGYNG